MNNISLFIKPYISLSDDEIIKKVKELGFSKIEYPVRNGLLVNPENCEEELPKTKNTFLKAGIEITSITSVIDERIFRAMNEADIRILRIMLPLKTDERYFDAEERFVKEMNVAKEYCEKYDVKVVIQPHQGRYIANLCELKSLIEKCDTRYIKAVWDIGHSGLAGEIPSKSADIIFDYLQMVNLKSAYYKRIESDGVFTYKPYYTTGEESPLNWTECIDILKNRGYNGMYCIHAEYTDPEDVGKYTEAHNTDEYLKKDIEIIKKLNI